MVKFPNNRQGVIVLVNETIVSVLAEFLRVSSPEGGIVLVPQELIDAEAGLRRSDGAKFAGGLCFGSAYYEAIDDPGAATLALASNIEDLAGIVLLDTLCANTDRENNTGNLLLTTVDGENTVMAIDHGHCFGYQWDNTLPAKSGELRVVCRDDFVAHIEPGHFDPYIDRMRQLDQSTLDSILTDLDGLWELTESGLGAVKTFIFSRVAPVEQALRERWPESGG